MVVTTWLIINAFMASSRLLLACVVIPTITPIIPSRFRSLKLPLSYLSCNVLHIYYFKIYMKQANDLSTTKT